MLNMKWMDEANCAITDFTQERLDEIFFPENEKPYHARRASMMFCSKCPVSQQCLDYAIKTHAVGVWAGTLTIDRQKLKDL